MQHDPTTANAHTTPWKNQGSLGFSTWQRHARLSLTEGGRGDPDALENQSGGGNDRGGIRAIYDRHASFSEGLIARRHLQYPSVADSGTVHLHITRNQVAAFTIILLHPLGNRSLLQLLCFGASRTMGCFNRRINV